jgi:hypothetical protein
VSKGKIEQEKIKKYANIFEKYYCNASMLYSHLKRKYLHRMMSTSLE